MNKALIAVAATASVFLLAGAKPDTANAYYWKRGDEGRVKIWIKIRSKPGEEVWHACRRVFQRDAFLARRVGPTRVRCLVDHSRIYDYDDG